MRIHTSLTYRDLFDALQRCQHDGRVSSVIHFDVIDEHGSRKRDRAFEVQLGANSTEPYRPMWLRDNPDYSDKAIRRAGIRHSRNGKSHTDYLGMCATWHEWGHFIAEVFALDPTAVVGGYDSLETFRAITEGTDMDRRWHEWHNAYDGRVFDFVEYQRLMAAHHAARDFEVSA